MNKRLNDKGSTLITVVVALAVVATLAVIVLWVSLINFQMKITDEGVKDNFYSAETVLDQICTGLQGEISEAYNYAYTEVMENYSSYTEEERVALFNSLYRETLIEALRASDNNNYRYSMDNIKSYVEASLLDTTTYPYAVIESTSSNAAPEQTTEASTEVSDEDGIQVQADEDSVLYNQDGLLTAYTDRIVIKGIKVSYTDVKGFTAEIETDIALGIPRMNFETAELLPDTFTYALIGNSGIRFSETGTVSVLASLYAGCKYAVDPASNVLARKTKKGPDNEVSITVDDGSTVNFENGKYIISDGNVIVNSANMLVSQDLQLWAKNIYVDSGTAYLGGATYLSDDLTLMGGSPKVKLGSDAKTGRFIAYGVSTDNASESSAIIINGKESTLDMSGLDELFVAGYSFISTSQYSTKINDALINNSKDIKMGSSISLKGDQIAYLVPGECIGTDAGGNSLFGKNPLSYKEFLQVYTNDTYNLIDFNVVSERTGKALKDYFDQSENTDDAISLVFVPGSSGKQDDILVYFYVSLSGDNASKYYRDFYDNNTEKLSAYANFYADTISSTDKSAKVYTAGTYCLYSDEDRKLNLLDESEGSISDEVALVGTTYNSLRKYLNSDYQNNSDTDITTTVFERIIDSTNLQKATTGVTNSKREVEYVGADGKKYKAVLINDKDYDYTYDGSDTDIKLIVTTGNVTLTGNFEGTIVALGSINIKKSAQINNADAEIMKKLMSCKVADTGVYMYDIFNECTKNVAIGVSASETEEEIEDTSYADIIVYENWTKK